MSLPVAQDSLDHPLKETKENDQEIRAKLRTRFLHSIQSINGYPVDFNLHEKTKVSAIFKGTDINVESFAVSDLQTPIGPLAQAMLRSSDVISFIVDVKDRSDII